MRSAVRARSGVAALAIGICMFAESAKGEFVPSPADLGSADLVSADLAPPDVGSPDLGSTKSAESGGHIAEIPPPAPISTGDSKADDAARARRIRGATHRRNAGIVVTSIGIAAQAVGAFELGVGFGTTQPAYAAVTHVGSHPFIDVSIGMGLSLIGIIMWPTGAAQWARAQRGLNRMRREVP